MQIKANVTREACLYPSFITDHEKRFPARKKELVQDQHMSSID